MFNDLLMIISLKLEKEGYKDTFDYLGKNYIGGIKSDMKGPYLLAVNSKLIKDKLFSLREKGGVK